MKKNNTLRVLASFAFITVALFISFSSCKRNKDCDLVLTVLDATTNGPVVGAEVHIYPNQTSTTNGSLQTQDQTATTDASGVATFTFKLPAILSADVIPPSPYIAPATTLVKLEEGRSVSKSIKVY